MIPARAPLSNSDPWPPAPFGGDDWRARQAAATPALTALALLPWALSLALLSEGLALTGALSARPR